MRRSLWYPTILVFLLIWSVASVRAQGTARTKVAPLPNSGVLKHLSTPEVAVGNLLLLSGMSEAAKEGPVSEGLNADVTYLSGGSQVECSSTPWERGVTSMYPGNPGYDFDGTYYSDFFTTEVGGYQSYCDQTYESWGTLDGQTFENTKTSCNFGGSVTRCYEKVNGVWEQITCP